MQFGNGSCLVVANRSVNVLVAGVISVVVQILVVGNIVNSYNYVPMILSVDKGRYILIGSELTVRSPLSLNQVVALDILWLSSPLASWVPVGAVVNTLVSLVRVSSVRCDRIAICKFVPLFINVVNLNCLVWN